MRDECSQGTHVVNAKDIVTCFIVLRALSGSVTTTPHGLAKRPVLDVQKTTASHGIVGASGITSKLQSVIDERIKTSSFRIPKKGSSETLQCVGSSIVLGPAGDSFDPSTWQSRQSVRSKPPDTVDVVREKAVRKMRRNSPPKGSSSGSQTSRNTDTVLKPDGLYPKSSLQGSEGQYAACSSSARTSSDSRDSSEPCKGRDKSRVGVRERSYSPVAMKRYGSPPNASYFGSHNRHRSRSRPSLERRSRSRTRHSDTWSYDSRRHDERVPWIPYKSNDGPSCSRDHCDAMYTNGQGERIVAHESERAIYSEPLFRETESNGLRNAMPLQRHNDETFSPDRFCREIPVEPRVVIRLVERSSSVRTMRSVIELPRPVFVPEDQEDQVIVEREPIREISRERGEPSDVDRRALKRDPRFYRRTGNSEAGTASRAPNNCASMSGLSNNSLVEMKKAIENTLRHLGRHRDQSMHYTQWINDYATCHSQEEQRAVVLRYWTRFVVGGRHLDATDHHANREETSHSTPPPASPLMRRDFSRGYQHTAKNSPQLPNFMGQPQGLLQPYMQLQMHSAMRQYATPPQIYPHPAHNLYSDPSTKGPSSPQLVVARGRPGGTRAPMFQSDNDGSRFSDDEDQSDELSRHHFLHRGRNRGPSSSKFSASFLCLSNVSCVNYSFFMLCLRSVNVHNTIETTAEVFVF